MHYNLRYVASYICDVYIRKANDAVTATSVECMQVSLAIIATHGLTVDALSGSLMFACMVGIRFLKNFNFKNIHGDPMSYI